MGPSQRVKKILHGVRGATKNVVYDGLLIITPTALEATHAKA